jgi:hypothetical protein
MDLRNTNRPNVILDNYLTDQLSVSIEQGPCEADNSSAGQDTSWK